MDDEKKYYSIGEVSTQTGIKQTVLRFWESEFDELNPKKNKFGHRVYQDNDIEVILKIKDLLYDKGLTIKGAKSALKSNTDLFSTHDVRGKLVEILDILKEKK